MQSVTILDKEGVRRALTRIAHEILERNGGTEDVVLVGVRTRGVNLAHRIAGLITQVEGAEVPVYELDASPFRDDRPLAGGRGPAAEDQGPPFDVAGKRVVLLDDVFFTGRTVRASIDGIMRMGRPAVIQFAVLVDRGHRELPIRADYVGKNVPTSRSERIQVRLVETDGADEVVLVRENGPGQ